MSLGYRLIMLHRLIMLQTLINKRITYNFIKFGNDRRENNKIDIIIMKIHIHVSIL